LNYIIYDLEATCWLGRPPKGIIEIIEIGAVKLNGFGEVLDEYNKFIKPVVNPILSGFCSGLTKIKQEDVDRAKEFPNVIEDFRDWMLDDADSFLLASWGDFDYKQLINDCKLHKLDDNWINGNHINLRKQYMKLTNNVRQYGLKNTIKREGFEFTGKHHRAISDAQNLAKIFVKYIDEWAY
jgi:inhibitor of KinA sporulation pathway (predicted exonuclease)